MTAKKPSVKKPQKAEASNSAGSNKRSEIIITPDMQSSIKESKSRIKSGCSKAEVARETYDKLKKHERKQVIHVFINGIGLSRAGAATYYQNCKNG